MNASPEEIAAKLNAQRDRFRAFLISRVGNPEDAEDLLQDGLVKALRHAEDIKDVDRAPAWFFQLLRNSIVDLHRSRTAASRRHEKLATLVNALGEDIEKAPAEWTAEICRCIDGVMDTLKPSHAELLRRVDLENESVAGVAANLGMTPNNASVTLHRARHELRKRLEDFCGACASGACLDCHCQPGEA